MRGAQLAADVADVHVDGLLLDRAFLVPCDLEQLALREHLARTSHEGFEDVELKAREAHGFFPHRKRAGVDVERPVFVAHRGCGGGFGEALVGRRAGRGCAANVGVAQLHLHASQQLVEVEGLGQVIVGAQLQQRHLVGGGRARRHHDDGHVAAGAHEAHHVLARHARQHEIGDHEVERLGAGKQQPPLAAREGLRASEPVAAQMHRHHLVDVGVVLDDHYGCRFAHRGYCTARQTREPAFREPQPHAPSFRSKPKRQNRQ